MKPIAFNWMEDRSFRAEEEVTNPLRASQTEAVLTHTHTPCAHVETMPTLRAGVSQDGAGHGARSGDSKDEYVVPVIAFDTTQITHPENRSRCEPGAPSPTLSKAGHPPTIASPLQVRRLTPRECERLQGFPDDYTHIVQTHNVRTGKPLKKPKPAKDGPRYKALGNSMAVPVMRWIGEQIDLALWCEQIL